jgi:eukaryotic-like serine/threonine-protein kinase
MARRLRALGHVAVPPPLPSHQRKLSYHRRPSWLGVDDELEVGQLLAEKYRLDAVLGEGSMGKLFIATDLALGRQTAIKVALLAGRLQHELEHRLLMEARAAAQLRTQHVARVLDIGRLRSGAPFVVFELLEGENLEHLIQSGGRLPIAEAVGYALEACIGLAEAHALGIVHRDIKPENLFLATSPDGSVVLKVLDFGASALFAGLTHAGGQEEVIGTPLYLAPERVRSPRLRDPRSDIWALGAVLYELIVGRPAFDAESIPDIVELVQHHAAPLLRHAVQSAPPTLERVIDRCLQKNPAHRFGSVAALAMALAPYGPAGAYDLAKRSQRVLSHLRETCASSVPPPPPPPPRQRLGSHPLLLTRES